jgi:hypothetical protein
MVSRVPEEKRKMQTKKGKATRRAAKRANQTHVKIKAARADRAKGTRLYALAGRPTKADFVNEYGPKGPTMT